MSLTGVYFLLTNIYLNEDDDDDEEEEKERTKREEKKKGHLDCRKKESEQVTYVKVNRKSHFLIPHDPPNSSVQFRSTEKIPYPSHEIAAS